VSTFETTIRALGGLVSAYELSGREGLLRLAVELGDGLLPAFNTKTGIAQPHVTFFRGGGGAGQTTIAEAGTLQVEFGGLAKNR
jgi:mannosidase alpha-like ER degradation enhancer 2